MLSYALWQRQFGSNANIIGQTVSLNRQPYIIIGVLPKTFEFPQPGMWQGDAADVFVPMAFTKGELTDIGDNFNFSVMARLDPGVSLQRANAELGTISDRILETYPAQFRSSIQLKVLALPLKKEIVGNTKKPLLVLLGCGWIRTAHCMREHRKSPIESRSRSATGNFHASCFGRQFAPNRTPTDGRELVACCDWVGTRTPVGALDDKRFDAIDTGRCPSGS